MKGQNNNRRRAARVGTSRHVELKSSLHGPNSSVYGPVAQNLDVVSAQGPKSNTLLASSSCCSVAYLAAPPLHKLPGRAAQLPLGFLPTPPPSAPPHLPTTLPAPPGPHELFASPRLAASAVLAARRYSATVSNTPSAVGFGGPEAELLL